MATVLSLSSHLPALRRAFRRAGQVLKELQPCEISFLQRHRGKFHVHICLLLFFICAPANTRTALPHPSRRYLFMSSVYMEAPLCFCRPFLPFPLMKDTCSRLHPSEESLGGMEFLHPNARSYLGSALSSRCCPVRSQPRPSNSRCTRPQPHSRKSTDL